MTQSPTTPLDARAARRNSAAWSAVLLCGLVVGPLIWAIQLYLNYGLTSHACFPSEAPRASFLLGWERIWILVLAVNLVCLAICAIGILASGYSWRRLRSRQALVAGADIAAVHTSQARMRSFAVAGLMISGLFTVAIFFDTLYLWALSTCSQV
jgi:Na+/proline symporter